MSKKVIENGSPYMNVGEAAAYMKVTPECVRRWARDGRLQARRAGWLYRFTREACDAMLAGRRPR